MLIIDAHSHLWETQNGRVNGLPVYSLGNGKSMFLGKPHQMMPPYMTDGRNTAEMFLSNMDYARVSAAVVTQEYLDGNQDAYVRRVREAYPDRFRVCSLYWENDETETEGVDGIKICAGRLKDPDMTRHAGVFDLARKTGLFLSVDMADDDTQTASMREMIASYPDVRIAIGHFGMVTTPGWQEQIRLASAPNVRIESGGITWLFNAEFYPYPSAVRAILEARDLVGMDKLMWGSDYPRTMTAITYRMSADFVLKSAEMTEEEKALFMGENAKAFYRFGDLSVPPYIKNMVE